MPNFSDFFRVGSPIVLPELSAYTLEDEDEFLVLSIHEGGMGQCVHLRGVKSQHHHALKCIRPDLLSDDDTLNQFYNELGIWVTASACDAVVEAIAVLRINEIPSVFQRWMAGGDLSHTLQNMSAERKVQTLLRVVRGLMWVHRTQGVIHCDLKPANILLDASGASYITDWGLARPISKNISKAFKGSADEKIIQAQLKLANSFTGTILYSSPEQILNPQSVDHRSDIYALGCIMYEMETGTPPFLGKSFREVARKHIEERPPKLGGLFSKTETGLERILEKCLEKKQDNRFSDYSELEEAIVKLANKRSYSLTGCDVKSRYDRYSLGSGHKYQEILIDQKIGKGKNYALMDYSQVEPFLAEAENLMSIERYEEASKLLKPYVIPSLLDESSTWHFAHSLAELYAYSLLRTSNSRETAMFLYDNLNKMTDKPAEFYVNYSLALLMDNRYAEAIIVCSEGISQFPSDVYIMGNQTLAYKNQGDFDNAEKSAQKRLQIRRDVHAIEECVGVTIHRIKQLRDSDLPKSIDTARNQILLIAEGLNLNPGYAALLNAELEMCCFSGNTELALRKFNAINNNGNISYIFKQCAFITLIDYLSGTKYYKTTIDLIERFRGVINDNSILSKLDYYKWSIFADHYMLTDYRSQERKIIKEVNEFFLKEENGSYQYPVMTARILEWLGEVEKAEKMLLSVTSSWDAKKYLALMYQRNRRRADAYHWAKQLVLCAPWKAESYDVFSYIARLEGDHEMETKCKVQADEIFEKEEKLFAGLNQLFE
ncbi:MAG: protein kinase [Christensenellales bacterium]